MSQKFIIPPSTRTLIEPKKELSDLIAKQVEDFKKQGGKIMLVPFGMSSTSINMPDWMKKYMSTVQRDL